MVRDVVTLTDWAMSLFGLPPLVLRPSCTPQPPTTYELFMGNIGFPGLFLAVVLAFVALLYYMFQIFKMIRSLPVDMKDTEGDDSDDDDEDDDGESTDDKKDQRKEGDSAARKDESKKDR